MKKGGGGQMLRTFSQAVVCGQKLIHLNGKKVVWAVLEACGQMVCSVVKWRTAWPHLQIADWLYAGPSVALRACPTWVWVSPRDSRRILNCRANSLISSRLMPSTVVLSVQLPTVSGTRPRTDQLAGIDSQEQQAHPCLTIHGRHGLQSLTVVKNYIKKKKKSWQVTDNQEENMLCS